MAFESLGPLLEVERLQQFIQRAEGLVGRPERLALG